MFYYKLVNYIASVYTPIKYRQELFRKWFLSFIPSYLYKVTYISENCNSFEVIYKYDEYREFNKLNNHSFIDGYYSFIFWNNDKNKKDKLILHSSHIKKALLIDSLKYLYAFDEHSMIQILLKYIKKHTETTILDINVNNKDVYNILKDYIKCFEIPKNVTPRVIHLLLNIEENTQNNKDLTDKEDITVKYFDVLMEDIEKKNDEYLIN